jgi:hypothetical protein
MAFARGEGLCIPDTMLFKDARDLADWLETSNFPQVLKLDSTSSGLGVRIVNDEDQLSARTVNWSRCLAGREPPKEHSRSSVSGHSSAYAGQIPKITLQQFIPGAPANRAP